MSTKLANGHIITSSSSSNAIHNGILIESKRQDTGRRQVPRPVSTISMEDLNLKKFGTSSASISHSTSATAHDSTTATSTTSASSHYLLQLDATSLNETERKVIGDFVHLLEKSRQLFNGLRELPQYGHKNNQWQVYFGRTFDVYTKLWKFQQQHRATLESKFNLKRWQIGEIASKIGQLYYHYYLRTSESNYLYESYSFYQAIQTRSYYSKANKEEKPDLMVKKLRYYARYIVVCLLLKKTRQVRELIRELGKQIDEYVKIYDPADQLEWQMVKNEINDFIDADSIVNVNGETSNQMVAISNRLNMSIIPLRDPLAISNSATMSQLHLQEILIVGNCQDQIKFSELSLDMFRMLQACEREPTSTSSNETTSSKENRHHDNAACDNVRASKTTSRTHGDSSTVNLVQRENPHKHLLYKPSFSQFYTYLAASFKDLSPHCALMVYLSADSCEPQHHSKSQPNDTSYDFGGVRTNNKKDLTQSTTSLGSNSSDHERKKSTIFKEPHCIFPGDLYPFLRKPFFLIVDSMNSHVFRSFPNQFGQPFVSLLSPTCLPSSFVDKQNQHGNLYTLFLSNPLLAFSYICHQRQMSSNTFDKCRNHVQLIFIEIAKRFDHVKHVDPMFSFFMSDDFLRMFLLRHVFCYTSLRLHKAFKGRDYYPSSQPVMPKELIENRDIVKMVLELASIIGTRHLFYDLVSSNTSINGSSGTSQND